MATPEEQITPADAAIVTTGTGRKGPEEHDLPESLKYDMDLCLEILRNVLGEYNPELLSTFDTVRHYAVEASAEHFAERLARLARQHGFRVGQVVVLAANLDRHIIRAWSALAFDDPAVRIASGLVDLLAPSELMFNSV